MKAVLGLVVLLVILIGGFMLVQKAGLGNSTAMGSYAYVCEDGSEFSMTPSQDVSSVRIFPGAGATFQAATLTKVGTTTARYEGSGVVFVGAGEGVQLTMNGTTMVCNPKPSADMAPWNWGDAGEGSGMQPDVTLVVSESIVGKWQSTDDAKFVREFKDDGTVVDSYSKKATSSGTFKVFTKEKPLSSALAFPLMDNKIYMQIATSGTEAETLNFSVDKLTPDELDMTYMDRGGSLHFTSVK